MITGLKNSFDTGKRMVVAKKGGESDGCCFETWENRRVTRTIHVPKSFHGNVMCDAFFGTRAGWNADETRIVYVAEVTGTFGAQYHCGSLIVVLKWCLHQSNGLTGF